MFEPQFCPNPECVHHTYHLNPKNIRWYAKDGFYSTEAFGKIQRYKCKACKHRFSAQTFNIDYYAKKKISYRNIFSGLISTSNLSDIARRLQVSVPTVVNREHRLAKQAVAIHSQVSPQIKKREAFVCDGFQSMVVNFYFPNNINIAVGDKSQYYYGYTYSPISRGGKLTEEQQVKKKIYENKWKPPPTAVSDGFSELLDSVITLLHLNSDDYVELITDLKPDYTKAINNNNLLQPFIKKNTFSHTRISSKEPRTLVNPLFPVNYMDRQFRKDLSEHVSRTICFGRNVNNQMERMAIYRFYHNFIKKFRVRPHEYVTHSDKVGIDPQIQARYRRIFFKERIFMSHIEPTIADRKILERSFETPLQSVSAQFIEKWCA